MIRAWYGVEIPYVRRSDKPRNYVDAKSDHKDSGEMLTSVLSIAFHNSLKFLLHHFRLCNDTGYCGKRGNKTIQNAPQINNRQLGPKDTVHYPIPLLLLYIETMKMCSWSQNSAEEPTHIFHMHWLTIRVNILFITIHPSQIDKTTISCDMSRCRCYAATNNSVHWA